MQEQQPWSVIFERIASNVQEIVRSEVRLAATELKQEAQVAARAGASLGAGAVLALYGGGFILACIACVLTFVIPLWLSLLIVGVVLLLAALAFVKSGAGRLKNLPKPVRTMQSVRETVQWARNGPM
ncbi:MAG TPA: phage holin family protein [Candidatus Acidoferrales bacterium]|nr:phage holin family protein [Candidatus Acidoferrales bacterium]